jgi:hypothetical protein
MVRLWPSLAARSRTRIARLPPRSVNEKMQAVIVGIVTTVIGIIVAILVTRHYYTRSAKHRLAIYALPSPSIFYGVDPEIRSGLSIQFRGEPVKELSVLEILIANEGATAVQNAIEPLTFAIGEGARIVDASVTYVYPEGRNIEIERISDDSFRCEFALLNPNEYFYVKLITDGRVRWANIKSTIAVENLPPRLKLESAAGVKIEAGDDSMEWDLLGAALGVLVIALALALPIVALYQVHPAYFPFSWSKFDVVWWLTPALVIAALAVAILAVLALLMIVSSGSGNFQVPPRRQKFRRPGRPYHPHLMYGYGSAYLAEAEATTRYPREEK